jgi:hypothetical protein
MNTVPPVPLHAVNAEFMQAVSSVTPSALQPYVLDVTSIHGEGPATVKLEPTPAAPKRRRVKQAIALVWKVWERGTVLKTAIDPRCPPGAKASKTALA